MTIDPTHDEDESFQGPPEGPTETDSEPAVRARIVRYEDAPDVLTFSPVDVGPADRTTAWLSASEGSFVDLTEWR